MTESTLVWFRLRLWHLEIETQAINILTQPLTQYSAAQQ